MRIAFFLFVLLLQGLCSLGQTRISRKDTVLLGIPVPLFISRDSLGKEKDTLSVRRLLQKEKTSFKQKINGTKKDNGTYPNNSGIRFTGGYAGYNFYYRSDLDTPYAEKNIAQHQVISTLNYTVAGIPIRVNTFIRRTNSSVFRDITDVQVAFDAAAYRNQLNDAMRRRLLQQIPNVDSLAGNLYKKKLNQATNIEGWLKDPLTKQKLIEANEILKVPRVTYSPSLPDTTNKKHEDSLRKEASLLLDLYGKAEKLATRLQKQADSLKQTYDSSVQKVNRYQQLANAPASNPSAWSRNKSELDKFTPGTPGLSKQENFLLGVRNFGLGRNNINYSDLTAKNISLNGINFEYNSWYYLAFSAGIVDYRFRDFVIHRLRQSPQYMYLARAGIGRLEKSYFIVSLFGGEKQLLTSINSSGNPSTIRTTGMSTEAKWQLERNIFILAEAAQSFSPDLQTGPPAIKPGWSLSDKSNKALSLKLSSWFPATASRLEAQYKFTGANYQSFTTFQANAEQKAWYIRGEQNLFNRQLKLVASVRSNDFSNPYIVQNYKANTVFKTFSLTFHRKNLPIVSVAYMPMTQLTKVDSILEQSQFHTLNISVSHFYKLGEKRASTNIVYTRFFNGSNDTAFIYYNSTNLYASQSVYFSDFTATVAWSNSQNSGYRYNVLEGNVNIPLTKRASITAGAKLNELNGVFTGVGGFTDGSIAFSGRDKLSFHLEKAYLPGGGTNPKLVQNILGSISFIKTFK